MCGEFEIPAAPAFFGVVIYLNGEKLRELVISDNVVNRSTCAFYGCGSVMSGTIPEGVTNIYYNAFGKCGKLKDVTILGRAAGREGDKVEVDISIADNPGIVSMLL